LTSQNKDSDGPAEKLPPCPICAAPGDQKYTPFCSKRCADVDLHRWLSGQYAIPTIEDDGDATVSPVDEK